MVSNTTEIEILPQQVKAATVNDFYVTRKTNHPITFARLEKGLLLFMDVYEKSKTELVFGMALWNHRLCYNQIKDGRCLKEVKKGQFQPGVEPCHYEHETKYRQNNLCSFWYKNNPNNPCKFGSRCNMSHDFEDLPNYHLYIRTETDANVYQLIRFLRNAPAHSFDSEIKDEEHRQDLYKQIIIIMVHLVHVLSPVPRKQNSIDHLNLFLEKKTIKQLISGKKLLIELDKPYDVPEIFFNLKIDFKTCWYKGDENKRRVDFTKLTPKFVNYFQHIFSEYYERRLEKRGTKAPWKK